MFYVYMIQSEVNGHYYVGFTENLRRRIKEHNQGKVRYTKPLGQWKMRYYEAYENRELAQNREVEIKRSRSKKLDIIKRINQAPSSSG